MLFSTFQILNYRISKNIQAIPGGFIHDNKKQMCQMSLKCIEPNGRGNDLKIAGVFSFLQNVAFEIQRAFLARHPGKNFLILLLIIYNLWSLSFKMSP